MSSVGSHFVLVHGASHGSWCWYKVRCLLEGCGHTVTCIDLKSAGIDPSDANTIFKFEDYNQPLLAFLSSVDDKVILVGHSIGGFNVTQALHKFPTKLRAVVYLAAAMAKNGTASAPVTPTSEPNRTKVAILKDVMLASGISPDMFDWGLGLGPNGPPTSMIMKKQFQREMYYSMSPLEDCTLAGMVLRPFPVLAMMDAAFTDGEGYEKVPRVFIKTLHDKMMAQESQDTQIEEWPPAAVFTIDSEHSAFFSNPVELFGLLLKVASKYF